MSRIPEELCILRAFTSDCVQCSISTIVSANWPASSNPSTKEKLHQLQEPYIPGTSIATVESIVSPPRHN